MDMRQTLGLLVGLSLTVGAATQAAEKITTTFADYPTAVVEGQPLKLTVNYNIAPELGEVALHVEMKSPRHSTVLVGEAVRVRGEGSHTFGLPAPRRQEEIEVYCAVWYGEVWTDTIVPLLTTHPVPVLTAADADQIAAQQVAAARWGVTVGKSLPAGGALAVLNDDLPGLDRALARRFAARARAQGLTAVMLNADEVCNPGILTREHFHALALTSSQVYPLSGVRALERYLAEGGSIVALGAPAFRELVREVDGRWMGETQIREELARLEPQELLFDFDSGQTSDWECASGPNSPATWEVVPGGAHGSEKALHCLIPRHETWNTFAAPELAQPFAADQDLTCFWARGGPATRQMAVEWREEDGSRWIATVPLEKQWRHYALTPHDFKYWQDNPSQGRGGPTDHLRPESARQLTFGLAMTHTPLSGGRHEFWLDEVGVTKSPFGPLGTAQTPGFVALEGLTPEYKFHRVTNAAALRVSDKQVLLDPATLPVPAGLMALHPRPRGTGYEKDRKWRFIPLLEAYDEAGEVCGISAALILNREGRFPGSMIASFALPPAAYDDALLNLAAATAKRMRDGVFLFEGGAQYYAYFDGEAVKLGAEVLDLRPPGAIDTRHNFHGVGFAVHSDGQEVFSAVAPLADGRAEVTWKPGNFAAETYEVTCTLRDSHAERRNGDGCTAVRR